MKKLLFIFLVLFSSSALATSTQPVIELNPQLTINATPIGHNKTVSLQVIDARPTGFGSANIDPSQNVTKIFSDQINKALVANGFQPVSTNSDNQLVVQILSINFGQAKGYLGSNSQTTVSASVLAKNASGASYTNTYMASAYSDNYLTPVKQTPNDQVNTAVNQLLSNLANDKGLMQFLAG